MYSIVITYNVVEKLDSTISKGNYDLLLTITILPKMSILVSRNIILTKIPGGNGI